MDYTTLVAGRTTAGSIAKWLNRDLTGADADTILDEAEAYIYSRLRVREMLQEDTGTVADGDTTLSLPTGWIQTQLFMFTGEYRLILAQETPEDMRRAYVYDTDGSRAEGQPRMFSADGSSIKFEVEADRAYDYLHLYYKTPTALSGSNTTNFLTSRYPRLLRTACLAFGADFWLMDQDRDRYMALADREIDRANAEADEQLANAFRFIEVM